MQHQPLVLPKLDQQPRNPWEVDEVVIKANWTHWRLKERRGIVT